MPHFTEVLHLLLKISIRLAKFSGHICGKIKLTIVCNSVMCAKQVKWWSRMRVMQKATIVNRIDLFVVAALD